MPASTADAMSLAERPLVRLGLALGMSLSKLNNPEEAALEAASEQIHFARLALEPFLTQLASDPCKLSRGMPDRISMGSVFAFSNLRGRGCASDRRIATTDAGAVSSSQPSAFTGGAWALHCRVSLNLPLNEASLCWSSLTRGRAEGRPWLFRECCFRLGHGADASECWVTIHPNSPRVWSFSGAHCARLRNSRRAPNPGENHDPSPEGGSSSTLVLGRSELLPPSPLGVSSVSIVTTAMPWNPL